MTKTKNYTWQKLTTRCKPPMRKVVVGSWGSWYFLCWRLKDGWRGEGDKRIANPRTWCDIPPNQFMIQSRPVKKSK